MVKNRTAIWIGTVILIAALGLLACSNPEGQTTSPPSQTGAPDKVEVDFFYESDNCFCLDLAVEWVNTTILEDYSDEIENGNLSYETYDTRDPATKPLMDKFNASKFALFITTIKGDEKTTWQVTSIWLYTDSTGTNQELKNKFVGEIRKNMDKALYGESR